MDDLPASAARFRALVDSAPCALFIQTAAGLVYANEALTRLVGGVANAADFWSHVHPDSRGYVRERKLDGATGEVVDPVELRFVTAGGEERWLEFSSRPLALEGEAAALCSAFDVTHRKHAEEEIERLAYNDGLTGLPNRRLFADRLQLSVAQAPRLKRAVAVHYLDLDRFKVINESLGHRAGDLILRTLADRLRASLRRGDTVARVGGDEFALLTPTIHGAEDAAKIAAKLLETVREPMMVDGRELFLTASLGISIYPGDGVGAEEILHNAEAAMFRAKDRGRDNFQTYLVGMNALALERLVLETDLRKAVPNDQFIVYYQPLLDLVTDRVCGVEALLRWNHPQHGVLPPAVFLDLAELIGVIFPIGPWMLRAACTEIKPLRWYGERPLELAVNLSARQFSQPGLVRQVDHILAETGFDPHCLELEITETVAMQNVESTLRTLRELKALGVRLAIDDFGTGHSSLSYLRRFPIDALKIDQSFVHDLVLDRGAAAIVSTIIAMARSLGLKVVAEGVETANQLAFLREHRCDAVQGYFLSPPIGAAHLRDYLTISREMNEF